MDKLRMPKPGEIYQHFKDKPYQIMTVATHTETKEPMVVYQALYGDFKTYVRPLSMFLSEVDKEKYPEITQEYRFELRRDQDGEAVNAGEALRHQPKDTLNNSSEKFMTVPEVISSHNSSTAETDKNTMNVATSDGDVNSLLMEFLDAQSYSKKLEVVTSNIKHMNDRLINDMAVALDCAVNEGPLDDRIQGLIYSLQTMCRFEDRRMR